jgi:hypothetical protein
LSLNTTSFDAVTFFPFRSRSIAAGYPPALVAADRVDDSGSSHRSSSQRPVIKLLELAPTSEMVLEGS